MPRRAFAGGVGHRGRLVAAHVCIMTNGAAKSANEVETLVLKAARGGGVSVGLAEDLAAACAYTDIDALTMCPCDSGAAQAIPLAIDRALAGDGAPRVRADAGLVAGYLAALRAQTGSQVEMRHDGDEIVLTLADATDAQAVTPLGRRVVSAKLAAHLAEMAARLLVPDTDASRAGGAGAGLTDND